MNGTSGDDDLRGLGGNDVINGGSGDDFIDGGDGNDKLNGGSGDDYIIDFGGLDSIKSGDGQDEIYIQRFSEAGTSTVDAGNDSDRITIDIFGSSKVSFSGGAGSDYVFLNHIIGKVDISLGSDQDIVYILFDNNFDNRMFSYSAITVTDFTPGSNGDMIEWDRFLGIHLKNWDQSDNPFSTGHVRLAKSGQDTLVQLDLDGGGNAYKTFLTLLNSASTAFTAVNFDGYDPRGTQTVGKTLEGTEAIPDVQGTMGDDRITAYEGGGALWGSGGSDSLIGGNGIDFLDGAVGHDLLEGRNGDDFLEGGTGNDRIYGGAGNDRLVGDVGNDVLDGGAGDDNLDGGFGLDNLIGGAGNDLLADGYGPSGTLDGGEGNDLLEVTAIGDVSGYVVVGGDGNDRINIFGGFTSTSGGRVSVDAGSGSDIINVGVFQGAVDLRMGLGTDSLTFEGTIDASSDSAIVVSDFVSGPWGDRIQLNDFLPYMLLGWNGSNPFIGKYLSLVQSGASTHLKMDIDGPGSEFAPVILVTLANVNAADLTTENLGGFSPIPVRMGTSRANRITGTSAAERIEGLAGNDQLLGGDGGDLILGGLGNDIIDGGTGADRLYGGAGNDSYRVGDAEDRLFENPSEGTDSVQSLVSFSLPQYFENLTLAGTAAINGTGNGAGNVLIGNTAGNRLRGEGGNDVLDGAGGADRMEGGKGDDTYLVDNSADLVIELNGHGSDAVRSLISYRLGDHVEKLTLYGSGAINGIGNALANVLTGNDAKNVLDGGAGADLMIGGKGNDSYIVDDYGDRVSESAGGGTDAIYSSVSYTLPGHVEKLILTGTRTLEGRGNSGSNTIVGTSSGNVLKGNDGHDTIDGGGSHDRIYGGLGNDVLIGGLGNDGFYFDTKLSSKNVDDILDFSAAKDTIYISAKIFKGAARGTLDPSAFHQGPGAADASDRIVYDQASGNIYYDADGSGAAAQILFATVTPGTALTNQDFVIF